MYLSWSPLFSKRQLVKVVKTKKQTNKIKVEAMIITVTLIWMISELLFWFPHQRRSKSCSQLLKYDNDALYSCVWCIAKFSNVIFFFHPRLLHYFASAFGCVSENKSPLKWLANAVSNIVRRFVQDCVTLSGFIEPTDHLSLIKTLSLPSFVICVVRKVVLLCCHLKKSFRKKKS